MPGFNPAPILVNTLASHHHADLIPASPSTSESAESDVEAEVETYASSEAELKVGLCPPIYAEVGILTGGKYIALSLLGQGYDGRVYICIPTSTTPPIHTESGVEAVPSRNLHAVKIPSSQSEVHILRRIAECLTTTTIASSRMSETNFPRLLASGLTWHATHLIRGPTLLALLESLLSQHPSITPTPAYPHIPKTLILHIALELVRIFHFLHSLEPTVTHGDVGVGNIMLECRGTDGKWRKLGFPKVVLIDFGAAREHGCSKLPTRRKEKEMEAALAQERFKVFALLKMMSRDEDAEDEVWMLFRDTVAGVRWKDAVERPGGVLQFREFLEVFEGVIEDRKACVSVRELANIGVLMRWVMECAL
ncbi:hypothetical protein K458DRAFT_87229 [Lentithecium fluviatile CBS 122367]|uniref:Protein kinase domain-containing protein n=1 Tax=Lentithecium fluviatile CBS 122367 TaxID=1168545 RepID=A0A6G1IRK8_9PLEO|nr:hypothetical protein K458DRAFT_87229 [Lentithecium fluviatile CBS 122367]